MENLILFSRHFNQLSKITLKIFFLLLFNLSFIKISLQSPKPTLIFAFQNFLETKTYFSASVNEARVDDVFNEKWDETLKTCKSLKENIFIRFFQNFLWAICESFNIFTIFSIFLLLESFKRF